MNDEQIEPEKEAVVFTPAEMTDAIKVLMADSKSTISRVELMAQREDKQVQKMVRVYEDLDNPRTEYGRTPTRQLALLSYQQSRGFLSDGTLADHKVIKNLGEELDKYVGQANMKFGQLRKQIETIPSPDNIQGLLNSNWDFKEIKSKVDDLDTSLDHAKQSRLSLLEDYNDFRNAYNEADHPTRAEMNLTDELITELVLTHNNLIHFLMGVFTELRHGPVATGLKDYKLEVPEEDTDSEEPTGNTSESE